MNCVEFRQLTNKNLDQYTPVEFTGYILHLGVCQNCFAHEKNHGGMATPSSNAKLLELRNIASKDPACRKLRKESFFDLVKKPSAKAQLSVGAMMPEIVDNTMVQLLCVHVLEELAEIDDDQSTPRLPQPSAS